jgi:S-methylmethionine-dependent homocysteine/selenocysteine methylase
VTQRAVRLAGSLPPIFGSYRPDLFRAEDAARAAIGGADSRPFWVSFTLTDAEPEAVAEGRRAPTVRSGESIAEAARAALDLHAQALLFNCSHASVMEAAIREATAAFVGLPIENRPAIGVYANAFAYHSHSDEGAANKGLSDLRDDLGPQEYLAFARHWRDAGASIIGGCCGIGPEYIAGLVAALRKNG